MNKKVIYTSIFGNYDELYEPIFIPDCYDFVIFTDMNLKSDKWKVKKELPLYEDNVRNAKRFKILPHRFLKDYEISIYIDGNFVVKNDINILVDDKLNDCNTAFYDHKQCKLDPRNCIYEEAAAIKWLYEINQSPNKVPKDNLDIIQKQINKYSQLGFPQNIGLISGGVILRRHNEKDCIQTMEDWWSEIKYHSKRDQLSFNYVAWKNKFKFNYLDGDIRDNNYFNFMKHEKNKVS